MAARLVLNRVVQGRGSTACTRLGSNRWMVSVKSRLGFVHVDVFWGSVSVNRSSGRVYFTERNGTERNGTQGYFTERTSVIAERLI